MGISKSTVQKSGYLYKVAKIAVVLLRDLLSVPISVDTRNEEIVMKFGQHMCSSGRISGSVSLSMDLCSLPSASTTRVLIPPSFNKSNKEQDCVPYKEKLREYNKAKTEYWRKLTLLRIWSD